MPEEVHAEVLELMRQSLEVQSIINEAYIPSPEDMKAIKTQIPDMTTSLSRRIDNTVKKLRDLIEQKKKLLERMQTTNNEEKVLQNKHKELLEQVKKAIKIIRREGLEELQNQTPASLKKITNKIIKKRINW